jgi:hypothetical protein
MAIQACMLNVHVLGISCIAVAFDELVRDSINELEDVLYNKLFS